MFFLALLCSCALSNGGHSPIDFHASLLISMLFPKRTVTPHKIGDAKKSLTKARMEKNFAPFSR